MLKDAELDYLVDLLESVGRPRQTEAVPGPAAVAEQRREARRFVARDQVTEWELSRCSTTRCWWPSELAANAVTHAHSSCRLRLSLTPTSAADRRARHRHWDPGAAAGEQHRGARPRTAPDRRADHRVGLEMVPGEGKVVWAELARP